MVSDPRLDIDYADVRAAQALDPIWSTEDYHRWGKKVFEILWEAAAPRREMIRDNTCRYKGYYRDAPVVGSRNQPEQRSVRRWPRVVINHTRDLVEQRISKTKKISPSTIVVPANQEQEDKISSMVAGKCLQSVKYANNFSALQTKLLRRAILGGTAFTYVNWNKNKGDPTPEGKKILAALEKDEMPKGGESIVNSQLEEITVHDVERKGDVEITLLHPERVLLIPGPEPDFASCPGVIIISYPHVTELRAEYPELKDQILPDKGIESFNLDTLDIETYENHACKLDFYFKSSRFLPNGMHFSMTDSVMLDKPAKNPISMTRALEASPFGNLPIEAITDIDIEGELYGWPIMMDLNVVQNQYDKITSLISRNIFLFCHPKWFGPPGTNFEELSNSSFYVKTTGPIAPTLAVYQPITQDIFAYWNSLEQAMGKLAAVYELSRGKAPQGSRTASQLMIYDEQEEEARAIFREKLETFAVSVDSKILAIIGEYWKQSDDRVIQVLGEKRQWLTQKFNMKDLQKDYVVRIQPSGALPDNKYARIRTLLEIRREMPGIATEEQIADMIDFGQHEKFLDYARMAVEAAEAENEDFWQGKDVPPPELYEDLISHWKLHAKVLQNYAFKSLPKPWQEKVLDHVRATEYLMYLQGTQNPTFKQQVMSIALFPLVFVEPEVQMAAGMAPPAGPDASMIPPGMAPGGPPQKPQQPPMIGQPSQATNGNQMGPLAS